MRILTLMTVKWLGYMIAVMKYRNQRTVTLFKELTAKPEAVKCMPPICILHKYINTLITC